MASRVIDIPLSGDNDPQQPLLDPAPDATATARATAEDEDKAPAPLPAQNPALQYTLQTTAILANFLPTGTVLTFELFSPFATNGGVCLPVNRCVTAILIALCAISGFVLSFSDSYTDETGDVKYGFATLTGLAVLEGNPLPPEKAQAYRLRRVDLVHGFMSVMIFAAVALLDHNVVNCFLPEPTPQLERVVSVLPIAIALLCAALFLVFPSNRCGIGFPVRRA